MADITVPAAVLRYTTIVHVQEVVNKKRATDNKGHSLLAQDGACTIDTTRPCTKVLRTCTYCTVPAACPVTVLLTGLTGCT